MVGWEQFERREGHDGGWEKGALTMGWDQKMSGARERRGGWFWKNSSGKRVYHLLWQGVKWDSEYVRA